MIWCHDPKHDNPCPQPCPACEAECDPTYLKSDELWQRVRGRLQEMADAARASDDWLAYNEAYKTITLLHYEEIYGEEVKK